MRKARYFLRCTIIEDGKEPKVQDCTGRYATLRAARETLKRFAENSGSDVTCRISKDKNTLRRYFGDDMCMTHTITDIKFLQK